MKTKFNDVVDTVRNFADIDNSSSVAISKLNNFASRYGTDIEQATVIANREISSEDKNIVMASRSKPQPEAFSQLDTSIGF